MSPGLLFVNLRGVVLSFLFSFDVTPSFATTARPALPRLPAPGRATTTPGPRRRKHLLHRGSTRKMPSGRRDPRGCFRASALEASTDPGNWGLDPQWSSPADGSLILRAARATGVWSWWLLWSVAVDVVCGWQRLSVCRCRPSHPPLNEWCDVRNPRGLGLPGESGGGENKMARKCEQLVSSRQATRHRSSKLQLRHAEPPHIHS